MRPSKTACRFIRLTRLVLLLLAGTHLPGATDDHGLRSGTYRGRILTEQFLHEQSVVRRSKAKAALSPRDRAILRPDAGNIAVIDTSGGVVIQPNSFDLRDLTLSFLPAAAATLQQPPPRASTSKPARTERHSLWAMTTLSRFHSRSPSLTSTKTIPKPSFIPMAILPSRNRTLPAPHALSPAPQAVRRGSPRSLAISIRAVSERRSAPTQARTNSLSHGTPYPSSRPAPSALAKRFSSCSTGMERSIFTTA